MEANNLKYTEHMLKHISCLFFVVAVFFTQGLWAQNDCILGVGVTSNETIIEVFQLNEEQADKMANFAAELQYRNELLNGQIENTRKKHPQSSKEDLMKLAEKYKIMMDSVEIIQKMIDKKVLTLFNKKQYDRYINLCQETYMRPIYVIPTTYVDSLKSPK